MSRPSWGVATLLLFAVSLSAPPKVMAGSFFSPVAFGSFSRPHPIGADDFLFSSQLGLGVGLLSGLSLGSSFELETGALLQRRRFGLTSLGFTEVLTQNSFSIPVVLRAWPVRFLSIGLGAYGATGVGRVEVDLGGVTESASHSEVGLRNLDYGAIVSAGLRVSFGRAGALVAEGRYLHGMANAAGGAFRERGGSLRSRDVIALVGFRFGGNR